jgi:hypothetical protein
MINFLQLFNFEIKNKKIVIYVLAVLFMCLLSFIIGRLSKKCNYDKSVICETEIMQVKLFENKEQILSKELVDLKKSFITLENYSNQNCNRRVDNERKICKEETSKLIEKTKKEYIKQKCSICK